MNLIEQIRFLLHLTHSHGIARRYFVTNGFDGALTMLGLCMGFYISGDVAISVAISACMGAAVALGVSGVTSAYISEAAERKRELRELEEAMVSQLDESAHGHAARFVPYVIALVNGMAPFIIALAVMMPLLLVRYGVTLPVNALQAAIGLAFFIIFLLGLYLGRISGSSLLWAGTRTLLIALVTAAIILLIKM